MSAPTLQRPMEITAAAKDYLKTEAGGAVLLLLWLLLGGHRHGAVEGADDA